jgi:phage regulator Rha-like protein
MRGKRARQIRKFLEMEKAEKDTKNYQENMTHADERVVGRKYQLKSFNLEKGQVDAERIETMGYKVKVENMNKKSMMYKAIKRDYSVDKQTILAALKADEAKRRT